MMSADSELSRQTQPSDDKRFDVIKEVLDQIRPNLMRDGGDCELLGIEGNKVTVKLTGACVMCSLSSATLEGIQAKIIEKLGEFVRVVPAPGGFIGRVPLSH
jgi:Fe-S cluster biogenesis protein NfuA